MRRTELLQEIRKMRFDEAYEGWQARRLTQLRWPEGFHCPECGNTTFCELKARKVFQCHRCHHQTSLTARTLFETKLPLTTWFLAIFLLTQSKIGLSALTLARHLGVTYKTAWLVKHKLMQTMREGVRYKQRRAMSKLHRLARTSRLTLPLWLGDNRGQTSALKRSVVA